MMLMTIICDWQVSNDFLVGNEQRRDNNGKKTKKLPPDQRSLGRLMVDSSSDIQKEGKVSNNHTFI